MVSSLSSIQSASTSTEATPYNIGSLSNIAATSPLFVKKSSCSKLTTAILIIDPQTDFHSKGALPVVGADDDSKRISRFINKFLKNITRIYVTMDTHQKLHIAHPMFWKNGKTEKHPPVFTQISVEDVENGIWKCTVPSFADHALNYVKQLKKGGKFSLIIWPEHCLIGSRGHSVQPEIMDSILEWEQVSNGAASFVLKGNNSLTEHYSAMKAEVEIESDPNTQYNWKLLEELKSFDRVIICGQALSHCVNFTVRDIAKEWPKDRLSDLVILTDCSSSVSGYEVEGKKFLQDMQNMGLTLSTSTELLAKPFEYSFSVQSKQL